MDTTLNGFLYYTSQHLMMGKLPTFDLNFSLSEIDSDVNMFDYMTCSRIALSCISILMNANYKKDAKSKLYNHIHTTDLMCPKFGNFNSVF